MTGTDAVAGLDLGTTATKVLVQSADGRPLAMLEYRTPWLEASGEGTETTAAGLADLARTALREAAAAAQRKVAGLRIVAVGVTGLAESGVLLDPTGRPCAPVIAWFDRRGEEQVAAVSRADPGFARRFSRATGLPWDCQASIAKLLWLRDQGIALSPGHRWLSVPEYVVHALGGDVVCEPSLASRTGLVEQVTGLAWTDGLAELGLPATLLPPRRRAGESAGHLPRSEAFPECLAGAELTVAGHDHPVAAVGAGATTADDLFNSTGTADVIARSLPAPLTDDQREELVGLGFSAGSHVLPGTALVLGGVRGGLVLRRVLGLLGVADQAARDRLDLDTLEVGPLPAGLAVSGAGPTGDDVVLRFRDDVSPATVWAAATRYTAGETRLLLETLHRVVPAHRRAVASGGWTRMASVRRAKSAAIDRLEFSDVVEPGVAGAARLAARAAAGRSPAPPTTATTHA
jgi:sugar (pentulose or hexulose) kinase